MSFVPGRLDSLSVADSLQSPGSGISVPGSESPVREARVPTVSLNQLAVLKALSVPPRLQILELLSRGKSLTGTELTGPLKLPRRRVHHHLGALESVGLLARNVRQDRREVEYAIAPGLTVSNENGRRAIDFGTGVVRFG